MIAHRFFKIVTSLFIAVLVMIISVPGSFAAAESSTEKPDHLNIAVVCLTVVEQPWITSLIQALERIKAEKPHGLDINWAVSENIYPPDAERVLREYAKTGKYGIIWSHAHYQEAIEKLRKEYPDILWLGAGGAFTPPFGGNFYFVDIEFHEAAYLLGMIAGMMTKSNTIGAVAAYPYADINLTINGYVAGAKAVNPDVKVKMTYLDSWFDPPRAKEATMAQIASGADFIYAERFGPFEACKEKGKLAFGHITDQYSLMPEVVVSSALGLWDPALKFAINEWWNHVTKRVPYNAPKGRVLYRMKDGATDLAPYYRFESVISQNVKDKVNQAKQTIKEGKLVVPHNEEIVVSQ